jgi:hypothetical protein
MPINPAPIRQRETVPSAPESPGTNAVEQITERQNDEPPEETSTAQSLKLTRTQDCDGDEVLANLEQANSALDKANTLEAVKQIADVAAAAEIYAKRAQLGKEAENRAAAYFCRASAKLGRMLAEGRKANRIQKSGRPGKRVQNVPISDSTPSKPLTLAALGLDKRGAAQARKLAKYAPDDFEARLKGKLEKLELSRTSTLEDARPKTEPAPARHFMTLLKDFEAHPDRYDARAFAGDQTLVEVYQRVAEKFMRFLQALEVEALS